MSLRPLNRLVALLGSLALAAPCVHAADNLLILIEQSPDGGAGLEYDFGFSLIKDGATSCGIVVDGTSYSCFQDGDEWFPEMAFWNVNIGLTFAELQSVLADPWVLTWDASLPSETVAAVDFGTLADGLPALDLPAITTPLAGGSVYGDTSIDWDINPGPATIEYFEADLNGPGGEFLSSDWLAPTTTTWTPGVVLAAGEWEARVLKIHQAVGSIPADVDIQSGSWAIGTGGWLEFWCIDESRFTVLPGTPVLQTSWSATKGKYR